tara:strand:+ start:448 stop:963 length:516 start_codon:yes stop_codon:yes gene_type:complete
MTASRKEFFLFFLVFIILLLSYKVLAKHGTFIDDGLRKSETAISVFFLQVFFEETEHQSIIRNNEEAAEEIYLNGKRTLIVINECDAFQIHLIFSVFILIIGGVYPKLISLLLGNFVIFVSNIVRLIALALIVHYNHDAFQFHHEYTFSLLLYLIVFVMWYFYLNEKKSVV